MINDGANYGFILQLTGSPTPGLILAQKFNKQFPPSESWEWKVNTVMSANGETVNISPGSYRIHLSVYNLGGNCPLCRGGVSDVGDTKYLSLVAQDESDAPFSIVSSQTTPALSVFLDASSPAAQNVSPGQTNVTFAKLYLRVDGENAVNTLNSIQIGSDSPNASSYVTNFKIYDGATLLSSTVSDLAYNGSYYYQWMPVSGVSIPGYSSKILTIVTDVKSTAPAGSLRLGIAGLNFDYPGATVSGTPVYGYTMTVLKASSDFISHWNFNEGEGTTINDSVGGNNGTLLNGATWSNGVSGKAVSLDGMDDYVSVQDNVSLRLDNDLTITAWIYLEGSPTNWVRIVGKGNDPNRNYGLWYYGPTGDVLFQIYNPGGSLKAHAGTNWGNVANALTIKPGQWYHLAGVKQGNTIYMYLDGKPVATAPIDFTPVVNADPLTIGYGNIVSYHKGLIDEVRIYNRALSAEEINNIVAGSGIISFSTSLTNQTANILEAIRASIEKISQTIKSLK